MSPFCCFKAEHVEEVRVCVCMLVCVTEQACFSGVGGKKSLHAHRKNTPLNIPPQTLRNVNYLHVLGDENEDGKKNAVGNVKITN